MSKIVLGYLRYLQIENGQGLHSPSSRLKSANGHTKLVRSYGCADPAPISANKFLLSQFAPNISSPCGR